ncbi:hypothetical protein AGMMS49546_34520 [Spirochaetia bacterium]|nr:hypothetical protein AGMMS49546_34520 [Spirochaetia bacterium]
MNNLSNIEIVVPRPEENQVLNQLDNSYEKLSEMTAEERAFINALILRNKPKKLLEIGVSAGSSSIVMLNAIKDFSEAILYSIDYLDYWYKSREIKVGFFVDNYPELKTKWKLYCGGLSLKFMEEIARGGGGRFLSN